MYDITTKLNDAHGSIKSLETVEKINKLHIAWCMSLNRPTRPNHFRISFFFHFEFEKDREKEKEGERERKRKSKKKTFRGNYYAQF